MKVGTDSILLGSWVNIAEEDHSVLDIGAGTGVLALMMAQRSNAGLIDAIEIEAGAYEQCVTNFEASPWSDRLFCYHCSLEEFIAEIEDTYDLILSNPPFHSEDIQSTDFARHSARHSQSLPFKVLLQAVSQLLKPQGTFSVIIPATAVDSFCEEAKNHGLFVRRRTRVRAHPKAVFKRALLEFGKTKESAIEDEITISDDSGNYTEVYTDLTKDFYKNL